MIEKEVNKFDNGKSIRQCKDKLRNLKMAYKDAKLKNKESGESPHDCPFYDDFDEILGTRPVTQTPGVIQVGVEESPAQVPFAADDDEKDESFNDSIVSEGSLSLVGDEGSTSDAGQQNGSREKTPEQDACSSRAAGNLCYTSANVCIF